MADDTTKSDREKAREALDAATKAAQYGEVEKAEVLAHIADTWIQLGLSEYPRS